MGNIVGEGFDSRISDQVNIRQKTHGSGYNGETLRTPQQLAVLNNNTAWIKLMSSVYIKELTGPEGINNPTIAEFKTKGIGIAKAFVLFNGTSAYDDKTIQREGIDFENTLKGQNNVYGIGGSKDFGLNPMMGITGIDVKHKNRGSIRTATVTVKAFNRAQFEIIDVLYMRLGFSVLLEWGNSIYFDNNDVYVYDGGFTNSLIDSWFKNNNYLSFLAKIRSRALNSNGNYDAMLAKVSNYHWSFQKDGSYDITIDLVSMGDIIESLNAGKSPNGITANPTDLPGGETSPLGKRLEKARNQNKWGEEFYSIFKSADAIGLRGGASGKINPGYSSIWKENIGHGEQIQYAYAQDTYIFSNTVNTNPNPNGGFLFIKLGKILNLLEKKIILKYENKNSLNLDYDYENNLIGTIKPAFTAQNDTSTTLKLPNSMVINQMSYNPYKCVTLKNMSSAIYPTSFIMGNNFSDPSSVRMNNKMNNPYNSTFDLYFAPYNFGIPLFGYSNEDFNVTLGNEDYGRIMNILVNVEFVLDVVDDKTNKQTGELPLIDFLKGILVGINESLGGINELDVFIDETTNTVKIIDTNPLPGLDNLLKLKGVPSTSTTFNLYGYNKKGDESNFIHDFNLTTEITPALSTMLTVAATANKTVVGEDNTALSKINKGLYDRYKSDITIDVKPTVAFTTSDVSLPPFRGSTPYEEQYLEWLISLGAGINGLGQEDANANKISQGVYGYFTLTRDIFDGTDTTSPYPKGIKNITAAVSLSGTSQIEQLYISAAYNLDSFNLTSKTSFWETIYDISIGDWNKENIDTFSNSFKDVNKKWNNLKGKGKNNPEFKSGFIPFNLSLTMDGLGGMKIYQKFNVDTDFMPSNYPSSIEFLIKNIQHTVKDNKWITKIESFCVSKPGSNVTPASIPSTSSTGLGHNIVITSGYAKSSTSTVAAYQAKIVDGSFAPQDITITFTDTLKNTSTPDPTPSLSVTIIIPAGTNFGTAQITFANAGTLKSSKKTSLTFSPTSTATYYLTLGPNKFVSAPPTTSTSLGDPNVGINPEDVITFTARSGNRQHWNSLIQDFKNSFLKLALAYKTKTGNKVQLNSATRTQAEQTVLWDTWVAGGGNHPKRPGYDPTKKIKAKVGGINIPLKDVKTGHGSGTAADVQDADGLQTLPEFSALGFTRVADDPPHIEIISLSAGKPIILILSTTTTTPYS